MTNKKTQSNKLAGVCESSIVVAGFALHDRLFFAYSILIFASLRAQQQPMIIRIDVISLLAIESGTQHKSLSKAHSAELFWTQRAESFLICRFHLSENDRKLIDNSMIFFWFFSLSIAVEKRAEAEGRFFTARKIPFFQFKRETATTTTTSRLDGAAFASSIIARVQIE